MRIAALFENEIENTISHVWCFVVCDIRIYFGQIYGNAFDYGYNYDCGRR